MGDRLGDSIQITTTGPVILGAASFWYLITGWEESLLMRDDSAPNLRYRPTRGWGYNQGLSLLNYKWVPASPGVLELQKKPQDGFRVFGLHWI